MVVRNNLVRSGMVLAGLVLAGSLGLSQETQQQTSGTQNSVPDAPRPQTLPKLNTISPGRPYPDAPTPSTSNTDTRANGASSALPSAPNPAIETEDAEAPPDMPSNPAAVIRVPVNFVELPFTAKDSKGQLVPGLTYRDVRVYEDGLRQHISFFTVSPFPLSVALVIDQSVPTSVMSTVNNALAALQGAFTTYDEVSVFTYNNGVKAQGGGNFTGAQSARLGAVLAQSKGPGREPNLAMGSALDQPMVKNNLPVDPNINRRSPAGVILTTPEKEYHTLNDAILQAAQATAKAGKGRRRVVYVISDGKEYGSKATQKEVIRYLQSNNVSVFATVVGDSSVPGLGFLDRIHLPLQMRDNVLPRYAAATGGQCDPEFRQKGIENSFAKITEEVRNQYTVGYYSNKRLLDSKFRETRVDVMRPGLTIITKHGYYPTPAAIRPAGTAAAAQPTAQ